MFRFTPPLYEILAREVSEVSDTCTTSGEQVVELSCRDRELLFRFTLETRKDRKPHITHYRMETWESDQQVSNNFDLNQLQETL